MACGPNGRSHGEGVLCGDVQCEIGLECFEDRCVECNPRNSRVCHDSDVYACNPDGTLGALIEECLIDECSGASCNGATPDCAEGAELVYVVDESYRLQSFDPSQLTTQPFTLIGNLSCPAMYPTWPEAALNGGPPTPFSMSVDRAATAWVLYSSGEIFHVSTVDASCQATSYARGQAGFELFGMGFVSDAPGSSTEKLFIAGGDAANLASGNLAWIDPGSMALTTVGPLPLADYSPELTGTGAAELYAYYPGMFQTYVARMDRASATNQQQWPMPALDGGVRAWAFAQWGGLFWIFVTTEDFLTLSTNSQVWRLDPMTGTAERVLQNLPYMIVGAGVSTCAPIEID
jgi:hypothetical protein